MQLCNKSMLAACHQWWQPPRVTECNKDVYMQLKLLPERKVLGEKNVFS